MITEWKTARTLEQVPVDNGIEWDFGPGVGALAARDFNVIKTKHELESLANTTYNRAGIIQTFTNQLILSNFGFDVVGNITGVELQIKAQRRNRVADRVIRLHLNKTLGKDRSQKTGWLDPYLNFLGTVENDYIYGGSDDLWDNKTLTSDQVNSTGFGVLLEFESNPVTPHKDPFYIEEVSMRIHYGT
jgi:hypothetical protein